MSDYTDMVISGPGLDSVISRIQETYDVTMLPSDFVWDTVDGWTIDGMPWLSWCDAMYGDDEYEDEYAEEMQAAYDDEWPSLNEMDGYGS